MSQNFIILVFENTFFVQNSRLLTNTADFFYFLFSVVLPCSLSRSFNLSLSETVDLKSVVESAEKKKRLFFFIFDLSSNSVIECPGSGAINQYQINGYLSFFYFRMQSFIYKETKQKTEKMKWKINETKNIGDRKERENVNQVSILKMRIAMR